MRKLLSKGAIDHLKDDGLGTVYMTQVHHFITFPACLLGSLIFRGLMRKVRIGT